MSEYTTLSPSRPDFISGRMIQSYKRDAKARAKRDNIKLHAALEIVAINEGFSNWHQVTVQRKRDESVEHFLNTRAIFVFNHKDAPNDESIAQGLLERDEMLGFAAYRNFLHGYVNEHDLFGEHHLPPENWRDDDPNILDIAADADEVMLDLVWYRFNQDLKPDDKPLDVLKRLKPHCFFPPDYVALRGIFYSVHSDRRVLAW